MLHYVQFCSYGGTLCLRIISAIEVKSAHIEHKFNKLEKGICGYIPATAFIEKIFAGFQGIIMRDRSTYTEHIHGKLMRHMH